MIQNTKQHSWDLSQNGHVEPRKLARIRVFPLAFIDSGSGALRVLLYFCKFFQIAPPKKKKSIEQVSRSYYFFNIPVNLTILIRWIAF